MRFCNILTIGGAGELPEVFFNLGYPSWAKVMLEIQNWKSINLVICINVLATIDLEI